jgi:hypothetical protein
MSGNICRCGAYSNIHEASPRSPGGLHEGLHYQRARSPSRRRRRRGPGAEFIAGGTNLPDLIKLGIEAPTYVIDVNGLAFDKIKSVDESGLRSE